MNTAVGREWEAQSAVIPSIHGTFSMASLYLGYFILGLFNDSLLAYSLAVVPSKDLGLHWDKYVFFIISVLPPIYSLPAVINHFLCL